MNEDMSYQANKNYWINDIIDETNDGYLAKLPNELKKEVEGYLYESYPKDEYYLKLDELYEIITREECAIIILGVQSPIHYCTKSRFDELILYSYGERLKITIHKLGSCHIESQESKIYLYRPKIQIYFKKKRSISYKIMEKFWDYLDRYPLIMFFLMITIFCIFVRYL